MNQQQMISIIVIIATLLGMGIYFSVKKSQDPIKIGYIGTTSGKLAAMGISGRNGALLAVKEINDAGGIKKRLIEMIVEDDAGDPENSYKAAQKLYEQGIKFIIGPFTTGSATAVLPFINQNKILTIGPATAGENLAGQDDYFIKLYPSTKIIGQKIASLALDLKIGKIAIITDHRNKKFGDTMIDGFKSVYPSKDNINIIEYFSNKSFSHFNIAQSAMGTEPEGVFIISSPIDTALIIQGLKKIEWDLNIFTSPWAISKQLIENGGKAIEGLMFYAPYIADDESERYKMFTANFQHRFNEAPTHVSQFNYEAVNVLIQGLSDSKSHEPDSVKHRILQKKNFKGIQSDFSLNSKGDANRKLYLHKVQNSAFKSISDIR